MQRIDLGIIIALKEEFKVFRSEFENLQHVRDANTGRYYYFFEWPQGKGRYKCAASFIGDMGPDAAAIAAQDFLNTWQPPAIAMLGIAGGIHEDVGIGDVIFADQVDAYTGSGKLIDENGQVDIQFASEVFRFPFDLMQDIDNIEFAYAEEFEQWHLDCRAHLERLLRAEQIGALIQDNILKDVLELQKGHIASGPYVVVSEKFKKILKSQDRSFKAVEMEAAGIMKAVYQQVDVPHALILRGISDHGNTDKKEFDSIGKGALRQYAMGNTIRLLKTLMQLNLLPKKRTSIKHNPNIRISIARLPTSEMELFGRESELGMMNQAWDDSGTNILSIIAFGGVGKTALVNHWLNRMAMNDYDGVTRIYGWSFYSQGAKEGTQVSAEEFFAHTLKWFGDPDPSSGSAWDKGLRLAELVQKEPTLLILDGMEPLQYPPGPMFGKLRDKGLQALIRELRRYNPGLCVITTRTQLDDIADAVNQTVMNLSLENLSENAGSQFLRTIGVQGTGVELKRAVVDFGGHALALSLLGRYLAVVHDGDINKRDQIPALTKEEKHGGHARRVMESYEKWMDQTPELDIVRMMGLFDRPAEGGAIEYLRNQPAIAGLTDNQGKLSQAEWMYSVKRLRDLRLLATKDKYQPDSLDCHPLVREHFEEKLNDENPRAWSEANSKLYEYYRDLPKKYLPDTMVEMEPLFVAVSHGCKAGRHQEAMEKIFWERIQRKTEYYSLKNIGALGANLAALSGFFKIRWEKPVDNLSEFFTTEVLGLAGYILRALGQKQNATQALRAGLLDSINHENWKEAAINAGNLSELCLGSGDLSGAVKYGREAVEYADKSKDDLHSIASRASLADALYRINKKPAAKNLFAESELMQKKWQPKFQFLYSFRGFLLCEFLLEQGHYTEVIKRAETTIKIATDRKDPLSIALDNLSLARGYFYQQLEAKNPDFEHSKKYFDSAVDGLRIADRQDHLAKSLISRSVLFRETQDFHQAKEDLDEAFEIAKLGGMKLQIIDFYIESARLYLLMDKHEDVNNNLKLVEGLISKTGYFLRSKDLEELKAKVIH